MSDPRIAEAQAALERAFAAFPHLDGHALTAATQAVCSYRDDLRRALRAVPADAALKGRLRSANLAATLLVAGHFPLGETPWAQMEALRTLLAGMAEPAPA